MPFADANGQRLYYEEHGDGEPLLCVMGLAANTLAWALQVKDFAERHRAVIFDNRDVGQSSMADGPYEIRDMAEDTLALADALGFDSFHLLGYSMGGAIAQEAALAAPERVKTLSLAVTFASGGGYARKLAEVWGARRERTIREAHIDELMLFVHSEEFFENAEIAAYVRQMMLADPHPQPPDAFVRQLDASSRHDTRDRLPSLEMPVHVIGAEWDILVPVWKSAELAELVPGARFDTIEHCPHAANIERAAEFNRLVVEWIAEASPAAV
jgi:3-oxoadipate enol-lactonase